MGTSCEIIGRREDGLFDVVHVSYDGYLRGVGLTLFKHYGTPEQAAKLFEHGTWAPSLEADPKDVDWDEWSPDNRGRTLEQLTAENAFPEGQDAAPGDAGVYIHAHGRWSAPRSWTAALAFLGDGTTDAITREMLIEDGATSADMDAEPDRPVDEHTGTLSVELVPGDEENCMLRLKEDAGTVWDVFPGPGFTGIEGDVEIGDATDLDGLRVVVRSTSVAASSSFGPQGSTSRNAMGVRSIRIVAAT